MPRHEASAAARSLRQWPLLIVIIGVLAGLGVAFISRVELAPGLPADRRIPRCRRRRADCLAQQGSRAAPGPQQGVRRRGVDLRRRRDHRAGHRGARPALTGRSADAASGRRWSRRSRTSDDHGHDAEHDRDGVDDREDHAEDPADVDVLLVGVVHSAGGDLLLGLAAQHPGDRRTDGGEDADDAEDQDHGALGMLRRRRRTAGRRAGCCWPYWLAVRAPAGAWPGSGVRVGLILAARRVRVRWRSS